jgi:predicted RNA-binding Zn-ribbon protein involved in translation (DUF1610 family)
VARAVSSGWTCTDCGTQRIRTVVTDAARVNERKRGTGVPSKCPACGHVELVPAEPGERIISIEYGPP